MNQSLLSKTSSRLERSLPPEIEKKQQELTDSTIHYCRQKFENSRFFNQLQQGEVSLELMQFIFAQYHFWRDQLHRWFGLCILKAASSTDPDQKLAILSLADHTFTDLKDGHNELFADCLHSLGLSTQQMAQTQPTAATIAYAQSFFDDFGYDTANFYEALAALSGRELCVALRNQRLLAQFFDPHRIPQPIWLSLHAQLEVDHFQDAIRPVLTRYAQDPARLAALNAAIHHGIDRHIAYFDQLLQEFDGTKISLGD
jgi:thiaminase